LIDLGLKRQKDIWDSTDVELPQHGGTYIDPIMGKPRQYDYRCRIINWACFEKTEMKEEAFG
jgi:hypothetical protein